MLICQHHVLRVFCECLLHVKKPFGCGNHDTECFLNLNQHVIHERELMYLMPISVKVAHPSSTSQKKGYVCKKPSKTPFLYLQYAQSSL